MTCSQHAALTCWPCPYRYVGGRILNNFLDKIFFATLRRCVQREVNKCPGLFQGAQKPWGPAHTCPGSPSDSSQMSRSHLLADQSYVRGQIILERHRTATFLSHAANLRRANEQSSENDPWEDTMRKCFVRKIARESGAKSEMPRV